MMDPSRWNVAGQIERLNALMAVAEGREACRAYFKSLLEIYPSSNVLWYSFAQWEFRGGQMAELERIFASSLKTNFDLRLWKLYIGYVKASAGGIEQDPNKTVIKAFELAIGHVGGDLYAMPIWKEYIDWCRSLTSTNLYEQQQLMDQVRRIYARALLLPLLGIEGLWHEYDLYENSLNKITAKKMLADKSPAYMTARACIKELMDLYVLCDRSGLPLPPSIDGPTAAGQKLSNWMRWIEWEKANPLKLPVTEGTPNPAQQRVIYAFRVALTQLRHYPEVWFEYARYMQEACKAPTEAIETILQQACTAIPDSLMVSFALADLYETANKQEQAKTTLERLLETLDGQCQAQLEAEADTMKAADAATKLFGDTTLAYIQMMQFSRRTEGIIAARTVFARGRKHAHLTYHLWVAAARMEYHCKRDSAVAGKIFELGMNKYGMEVEFVKEYLSFLIQQNDDQNIRAIFERALQLVVSPDASLEIWRLYLDYEYRYGEHQTVKSLERRLKAAFPNSPHSHEIDLFTRRFTYGDLYPSDDRAWLLVQPSSPEQSELKIISPNRHQPFTLSDAIVELVFRLPTAEAYKAGRGPLPNAQRLVSILQNLRVPGDHSISPPVTDPVPLGKYSERRTAVERLSNKKSSASSSSTSSSRRHEKRKRSSRHEKSPVRHRDVVLPINKSEPDLLEQRFNERIKNQ